MEISIGILAGGKSSRFGKNKVLAKFGNKTFLDIIVKELIGFNETIISVDSYEKYKEFPYTFIEDENKNIGPIEGIRQILMNSKTLYTFICAADMPHIKREAVEYLAEFISSDYDCYIMSSSDGIHPLCGIYSKKALVVLEESIKMGNYKVIDTLNKLRTKYIKIENSCFSNGILKNVNTLEDYNRLRHPFIFCVSGVKNSGKTTLIIELVKEFKKKFSKIAVIKHDGHDFEIDNDGTDTGKFLKLGLSEVFIFSRTKYAGIIQKENISIEEIIGKIGNVEMIIIEGMKYSKYPKIEIIRNGISNSPVCSSGNLIAIASDLENISINNTKIIPLSDINKIADTIINYFQI